MRRLVENIAGISLHNCNLKCFRRPRPPAGWTRSRLIIAGPGSQWRGAAFPDRQTGGAGEVDPKIRCLSGVTQIAAVLVHALREAVNGSVPGSRRRRGASQPTYLARSNWRGWRSRLYVFEGEDPGAAIFQEIASVTEGAFGHFDQNSARMLADLLKAVAAFAAGGRLALEAQNSAAARLLLNQVRR
jgi:hypothetical protein